MDDSLLYKLADVYKEKPCKGDIFLKLALERGFNMGVANKFIKMIEQLEDLYKSHPYRGSTFLDLAVKNGFKRKIAKVFIDNEVIHDEKLPKPKYIPIVSKAHGAYQMDTFINQKEANGLNYLMLINVNTRKAYAYPMKGKGTKQVIEALNKFIKDVPNVYSILSDQDKAYLSNEVIDWMQKHNVQFRTTQDDNHNNLGIINRFMRTIRDKAYDLNLFDPNLWDNLDDDGNYSPGKSKPSVSNKHINNKQMQQLIKAYNDTPHKSLRMKEGNKVIKNSPDDMNDEKEDKYIRMKKVDKKPYDFKVGEQVKVVEDKQFGKKKRRVIGPEVFTIESQPGNLYRLKARNMAVNDYPGYKIVRAKGKINVARDLKNDKRGQIESFESYNPKTNSYTVKFEDGTTGTKPARELREGNPTKLSRDERIFWLKQKTIPPNIRKFI